MFLSRIQLTPALAERSQLGLLLRDSGYGLHRLLWDLFSDDERFLFREENAAEQGAGSKRFPLYYVLSKASPKNDSPLFEITTKPFNPTLNSGDTLSFKLRANPTIARKTEGKKNSKRHDVVMDAQKQFLIEACRARNLPIDGAKSALKKSLFARVDFTDDVLRQAFNEQIEQAVAEATHNWLASRGERGGFTLQSVQATGYGWRALPEKNRKAGFSVMDYEGVLEVTDPQAFIEGPLFSGLGPAKAFGCGLMLIRRL